MRKLAKMLLVCCAFCLRLLKWIGIAVFVVFMAAFTVLTLRPDAPPPEDADLRIAFEATAEDENAWYFFKLAGDCVVVPEGREESYTYRHLLDEGDKSTWNSEFAARVVEENDAPRVHLARGLACPGCRVANPFDFDTIFGDVKGFREVARVSTVRGRWLLEQGESREAVAQLLQVVRVGSRIQASGGPMICYVSGVLHKQVALRELRRALAAPGLDGLFLRRMLEDLADCGASVEALTNVYKLEYWWAVANLDDPNFGARAESESTKTGKRRGKTLLYKPNKTKRLVARTVRLMIESASETYADAELPDVAHELSSPWSLRYYLNGNAVGIITHDMLMGAVPTTHLLKCRENCAVAATRILIALRCYQLDRGKLPETLDELVPEYLQSVPLDDFDGKPMKYTKEKKVVYAVGKDLTDNGGIERRRGFNDDGYDLIYKIEF